MANSENKINVGDTWKDLSEIKINISNSWKNVTEGYINVGNDWKQFWAAGPTPAFRFEVITAGADTFQLPIYNGGTYNFNVDWGDSSNDDITAWNDAAANHSYAGAGTWNVVITGTITGWRFNGAGDRTLIHDISEWGPLNFGSLGAYFYDCTNLTISATDIPDLSGTTLFTYMFWNTAITTIPNINSWNISSITNTNSMFRGTSFNSDISNWDFSSVIDADYMFYPNASFNQDVGGWNITSLTTAAGMFYSATSFDQDLSSWDITGIITTTFSNFLNGVTLSTVNYSNLLIGWEAQVEPANCFLHGGNSLYSAGAAATARAALVSNGWTIVDGGPA